MNEPKECPSADEFACFIEGQVESPAAERIRTHLDTCYSCRLLVGDALRAEPTTVEPRTFPVGEILNRRFRIERFIARGGMGEVYEAWDLQLRETIALKTIVCTGLDNVRLFPRIRAEVQLARRVTHPNVCRILEFGIAETRDQDLLETVPFFTMEYLRGTTLREYLRQHGPLPESLVTTLALQILDGLSAVHAAGIVHRDLKPENVFVVPTDTGRVRAVVMDFGLARSTVGPDSRSSFSSDMLVGTPAYMAPEQPIGGQPTPAWDIYALGMIVFELLTGALPFRGKTAIAMAMARVKNPAPLLSSVRPGAQPELEAAIACCLQTDPKNRFASAEATRRAFARVRAAPSRRHKRLLVSTRLVAAALGAAAILSVFATLHGHRAANVAGRELVGLGNGSGLGAQQSDELTAIAPAAAASDAVRPILSSVRRDAATTRHGPLAIESRPNSMTFHPVKRASQHSVTRGQSPVEAASSGSATSRHPEASSAEIPELRRKQEHSDELAIPTFALPATQASPQGAP